ncbi:MAG: type I-U CRISPR-associated protein Cas5/Cas6 [Synechococcus sp. SB0665_bin_28]|nr:type I-U CRISPR-associated protein Cas5/Cas6 [Synechococcus sp. SB0665_bin_28]MYF19790.1 type I-U CRISPR-associated protein Cas5/Cas6 [Synechococcus sp. SB0677_bin_5]
MTVLLAFRFLAGRYHATPFGHHVNEGLIEWPPSPWRLLRALISVGYTSGLWDGAGPPDVGRNLIERLSCRLPCYYLPDTVGTHSRHYMPTAKFDNGKEKTTLVFDTWARVKDENQELVVIWRDVTLEEAELSMLSDLVERLNYLGRSESWIEGRVMKDGETISEINCFAEPHEEMLGRNWEQVALLAPENAETYKTWRAACLENELARLPLPAGKKKPSRKRLRDRERVEETYPVDLLDCLQKDTTWLRSHGWSRPPGSRRIFYWRRSNAISISAQKIRVIARSKQRVPAMLLSLTNASRNDHALPQVTRTLPQAELLHRALISIAEKVTGKIPQELTGRDETGKPLQGAHEHAHINPLDLDSDGHLDHVLVWATSGLGITAQEAIRAARKTFTKGGIEPLRLALAATGDFQDLAKMIDEYGRNRYGRRLARLAKRASNWQSVTPFVPPRYIKMHGKNCLEGQIRTELSTRGFPNPTSITILAPQTQHQSVAPESGTGDANDTTTWNHFRHFKLARQRGPQPPLNCGFAIRLGFPCPVPGPIAIGYGSHFGLGLLEGCGGDEA